MAEFMYQKNEEIRCFSHDGAPTWYEAKIMGMRHTPQGPEYYIHYKGWARNFDEWVPEGIRLARESLESVQAAFERDLKRIREEQERQKEVEKQMQSMDNCKRKLKIKLLPLSLEIKESLLMQFRLIGGECPMLWIDLPKEKRMTINGLCSEFSAIQKKEIESSNRIDPDVEVSYLQQTMASIRFYFNRFLTINILFETEQIQKEELDRKLMLSRGDKMHSKMLDVDYCDIYGAEHLFRLLFHAETIYNNQKFDSPMQTSKISNYVTLFQRYLTKQYHKITVDFDIETIEDGCGLVEQSSTL